MDPYGEFLRTQASPVGDVEPSNSVPGHIAAIVLLTVRFSGTVSSVGSIRTDVHIYPGSTISRRIGSPPKKEPRESITKTFLSLFAEEASKQCEIRKDIRRGTF